MVELDSDAIINWPKKIEKTFYVGSATITEVLGLK